MSEELKPWRVVPNPEPKNAGMASARIAEAVNRPTEQQQAARIAELEADIQSARDRDSYRENLVSELRADRDTLRERVKELEAWESKVDETFEKRAVEESKMIEEVVAETERWKAAAKEMADAMEAVFSADGSRRVFDAQELLKATKQGEQALAKYRALQ